MDDDARIKRPKPERIRPLRSMSSFLGTDRHDAPPRGGSGGAADGDGGVRVDDVVARSVDLGYRVIDEYVRQGQRVARSLGDRSYSPGAMVGDLQELSGRLAEYAAEFASVWSELIQLGARSGLGQGFGTAQPAAGQEPPVQARTNGLDGGMRLRISVLASRATQVSVDLRSVDEGADLIAHALRAVDPAKPRIADITLGRPGAGNTRELHIKIPDDQPPGTYTGVIVEADTNRPAGTVSVSIPDA